MAGRPDGQDDDKLSSDDRSGITNLYGERNRTVSPIDDVQTNQEYCK